MKRYRTKSARVNECRGFAARWAIWLSLMSAVAGCLGHDWLATLRDVNKVRKVERVFNGTWVRRNDEPQAPTIEAAYLESMEFHGRQY